MITGMVGLPGAGKTLHVVGEIIKSALIEGRMVITNININVREMRIQCGEIIDNLLIVIRDDYDGETPVLAFSDVSHFTKYDSWRKQGDSGVGPVFVVDECHAPFADCIGLSANKHPIVQWMAKHRHKGSDVYLITQEVIGIPSAIRKRVEVIYKYVKKGFLGLNKSFRRHTYDTNGNRMPGTIDGTYNPQWYKLYQSYAGGAVEDRTRVPTIWSDWRFKMIAVVIAICIAASIYTGGFKAPWNKSAPKATESSSSAVSSESAPVTEKSQTTKMATPANLEHERELAQINADIDLVNARRRLERVQAGCIDGLANGTAPSGIMGSIVGGVNGASVDKCGSARPIRYMHDQVGVRIVGSMLQNAQRVYWLQMSRGGAVWLEKDIDLEPYGFTTMAVNDCLAWLKGERGNFRITCDGPNIIGYEDAVPLEKPNAEVAIKDKVLVTRSFND